MPNQKLDLPVPPSLWRSIGPSFILLGLALGSGELLLWPYLAVNWGLGLMWGALLGVSFQYVLNTEVMRYSLYWGESVFTGFRRLSILLPVWFIFSTFIPWSLPGFSSAASDIFGQFLPGIPKGVFTIGLLLLTGLLLSSGRSVYKTMERFQKVSIFIGLPFILFLAYKITNPSDWTALAGGLIGKGDGWWFFPEGVAIASFLGAFAYAGAGGNLNLAQSYYIKEKGFGMGKYMPKLSSLFSKNFKAMRLEGQTFGDTPANRRKWLAWWRLVNLEHFLVFATLSAVTIAVLSVLARSLVYGSEVESGLAFLYTEAQEISLRTLPVLGTAFLLIAAIMLFSTQVGVLESSSRIISENVILLFKRKNQKVHLSKFFYIALWSQVGLGMLVYLIGFKEARSLILLSAVLNAAAMMVSFVLIYILNRSRLAATYQASRWRIIAMAAAFLFFLYFLIQTVNSGLG
ncbi:MAG: hypothetical protein COU66_03630 [Candidatus Pacebacteria bacterium CG10_big_fil_rev_8_21_14_0_10_44_11]|nr:MAG: hypothetical protein COU66_03630 [Candidatus Pacebacteria bacterium CG10_big_fil_rev_8_21_14_0_10_44_11]